jgi:hypothetical protein
MTRSITGPKDRHLQVQSVARALTWPFVSTASATIADGDLT